MNVLLEYCRTELTIKNSRFIAECFPVETQAQARSLLHDAKQKYFDATHVVHAFITGHNAEVSGMSDDGEPSGTAGRPVLDVLKGSGITNILLTVTRYFGGTLLGTGGLVHAYGDCAKQVLSLCKSEPFVEKRKFTFRADYSSFDEIKCMFSLFHLGSISENYGAMVDVTGEIWSAESDDFALRIKNLTRGRSNVIYQP